MVNITRGRILCDRVLRAETMLTRMRGLLGREELPQGEGMLLAPAPAIHTAFMRFPIDAVFLDRELRVMRVVRSLEPWRAARARGAHAVLELPAGETVRRGVGVGDCCALLDDAPASPAPRRGTILLSVSDRRFGAVISMLLSRSGYDVAVRGLTEDVVCAASATGADIVIVEPKGSLTELARQAARLKRHCPRLGIVAISEDPTLELRSMPVVLKWSPLETLLDAIEHARVAPATWRRVDARL